MFFSMPERMDLENQVRSSSLSEVITSEGDKQRTDYYDENGQIAFAADKHYATLTRTRSDHTQLEEYFDAEGKPSKQGLGYYALRREYDDLGRNIKYLGIDGFPKMISPGYAIAERSYDQDNRVDWEMYLDTEGKPVETQSIGYGCHKEYDENGRNTLVVYVDVNKNPMKTPLGYAILHRTFIEEGINAGKVENEFYFDEIGRPVALSHGEYGLHKEYDEFGRCTILIYLNLDGHPMETKEGYTIKKRTFYPDDSVRTEMYFDINGKAISLSQGQYGILKENERITFLDKEGKVQFNLSNYLYANPISVILIALSIVLVAMVISKKANGALLVAYLAFIAYMTLMYRSGRETRVQLKPFWSYKQFFLDTSLRQEILFNIWLFVSLGAILKRLLPNVYAFSFFLLLSVMIEIIQFNTGMGLCELDDLISNGFGGLIGVGFVYSLELAIKMFRLQVSKNI